jgi:hypothetical protein
MAELLTFAALISGAVSFVFMVALIGDTFYSAPMTRRRSEARTFCTVVYMTSVACFAGSLYALLQVAR